MPKTKTPKNLSPRVRGRVLPTDLDLPPGIADANNFAIAAAIEMTDAEREQGEAARAVKGAVNADLSAARRAAEAGESELKLGAAEKTERHEKAQVRARVATAREAEAAKALRAAIREDGGTYLAAREDEEAAARAQFVGIFQSIPELYAAYLQAQALARPARKIVDENWSGPVVEQYPDAEVLISKLSKAIKRAKTLRDLPSFEDALAALIVHANDDRDS